MPFKLRLKKSRQYNVVSKSLFVCCVELLDGGSLECTLESESTGRVCLDNVCQRLGLNQPEYFGLQYIPRNTGQNSNPRWLEKERPVKRQLDKHASGPQLLLRVMFYITCPVTNLLTDETSRYHYFLQLKMDVIEGRIITTPQQAVVLASYSMQAEFGNFDAERHTPEYLKDFQLFPKHLTESESDIIETLAEAVTHQHAALRGLPSANAEERYICACQNLEGYGQEKFIARDDQAQIVEIGISLNGITVLCEISGEKKFYTWSDISNVINHKKYFTIECTNANNTVQYQFNDIESAKHVWRMCVHQHTFHTKLQMIIQTAEQTNEGGSNRNSVGGVPSLNPINNTHFEYVKPNFYESHEKIQAMPQSEPFNSQIGYDHVVNGPILQQRAQSTSCLDLSTDVEKLRALLPSYRAAPDYETAVQQKYRSTSGVDQSHVLYSSQPEIRKADLFATRMHYPDVTHNNIEHSTAILHQTAAQPGQESNAYYNMSNLVERMHLLSLYKPPPPYPSNRLSSNSTPDLAIASSQRYNIPVHHIGIGHVTGSSPDLVSSKTLLKKQYLKQMHQLPSFYEHYFPSPSHSYAQMPNAHDTYENLANVLDNKQHFAFDPSIRQPANMIVENRNITKHVQKIIDEHGNIIYCMPAMMKNQSYPSIARNSDTINFLPTSPTSEPIYENVPLPWQDSEQMIRDRTESIQSAPETLVVIRNQISNANISSKPVENVYKSSENIAQSPPPIQVIVPTLKPETNDFKQPSTEAILSNNNNTKHNINAVNSAMKDILHQNDGQSYQKNSHQSAIHDISSDLSYRLNNSLASGSSVADSSQLSSSSTSSKDKKKSRWGLLGGKSKSQSSDKVKSTTLGRETRNRNAAAVDKHHRWSTGLPRQQPLPLTINKETMCQILEHKLSDGQIFFEFEKIPKKKPDAVYTTALRPENILRNRFKDVLPYEENRVRLTPTKENKFGYINASHITVTVGDKQRFYIAAQGPTKQTIEDFWHAVWQADVYLIVQLTDSQEDMNYIPLDTQRNVTVGPYQIWSEYVQSSGNRSTSKLRVCNSQSRHYRSVWHMMYGLWGEQGCPFDGTGANGGPQAQFLEFLEELRSVREHSVAQDIPPGHNRNPPTLVHCTAGVGRTGVAILCDLLLYTIDHNQELDVARTVGLLRHQRAYMVQTVAQYQFVYSLLIYYLKRTRLI